MRFVPLAVVSLLAIPMAVACGPIVPAAAPVPKPLPTDSWPPTWSKSLTAEKRAAAIEKATKAAKAYLEKDGMSMEAIEVYPEYGEDVWRVTALVAVTKESASDVAGPAKMLRFGQFLDKTGEFLNNGFSRDHNDDIRADAYRGIIRNQLELMYSSYEDGGPVSELLTSPRWDPNLLGFGATMQKNGYYLELAGTFDIKKQMTTVIYSGVSPGMAPRPCLR